MLTFVYIESASRAVCVLLKPWLDTLCVEMMFASEEENLLATFVDL